MWLEILKGVKIINILIEVNFCYRFAGEFKRAFAPLIVVQLLLGAITIGLQMIQIFMVNIGLF